MAGLSDYEVLVAVIDRGSLTAAARQLNRSLQSVSRSLASLERELGVGLVRRTTRVLAPTPAGLALRSRIGPALAEIEAARVEASEHSGAPSGPLRIGAAGLFAPAYLVPAVATFMLRHPGVTVELVLEEDFVDLVAANIDLSVRIGDLESSALMVRKLGVMRRVTFASPSYLERRGRPARPADLALHDCLIRTTARDAAVWTYARGGSMEAVQVSGRFHASTAAACNEAAALGLGIGLAPLWQVRGMLDLGSIELLLSEFEPSPTPVSAVWPSGAGLPLRTRLMVDFLAARFRSERW